MGLSTLNDFSLRVRVTVLVACAALLTACASRSFTKPRSQVIEESLAQGIRISSIEQERAAFLSHDELQNRRLLALLRKRSAGEYRDANYRLGPGDEVEVNVFDVPELNVTAPVRQSGFVSLPLIGALKASGLTEMELAEQLKQRLSTFVRNPQISVFVSNYGSQKVAVMGAVRTPGSYPLKKGMNSLLELVSQAGGVNDKAGNFVVFIPAELSGIGAGNDVEARARLALAAGERFNPKESGIEVYLDQVMGTAGGIPLEVPVRGGDMIIVPEAGKIMVEGEVKTVGQYDLGQQMTLLGGLAAAGGITYGAKVDEVEIVREIGFDRKARLVISLERIANGEEKDIRLRNGDLIIVPSHSGRRLTQDTFEGISRVINLGIGGQVNLVK